MLTLRPYQEAAVSAVYDYLREHDDNPCIVVPTGGGKTPILATICKDAVTLWSGRVLILAHVKELLEQSASTLTVMAPELFGKVGVYSAGLGSRDTNHDVIVAGIQSVYKRACELGRFDLVLVDEAHLIPPDGEGMYRTFLADASVVNPNLRVIGLTATPYRMKCGLICHEEHLLNSVCYEVGVKELIDQGFLSPLISKAGKGRVDTSNLHIRAGEFISSEVEDLMDHAELVKTACQEIVDCTWNRTSTLIFAAGVIHAEHVADCLEDMGKDVRCIFGSTPAKERAHIIAEFKSKRLPYLVNVSVLTTGFDAPNVDCIAMMRPTNSPGLYYQIVGRGFRLAPGKENCLVLDFAGNIMRHGPVDAIEVHDTRKKGPKGEAPMKECPECEGLVLAASRECEYCGYEFPLWKPPHDPHATEAPIISEDDTLADYIVGDVEYHVHVKRGARDGDPLTMRVDYACGLRSFSEWVCFEHDGFARRKAESWWRQRSMEPVPDTVEHAVAIAMAGGLAEPGEITIKPDGKYDRVVGHVLGPIPEPKHVSAEDDAFLEQNQLTWEDDYDLPF